MSGSKCGIFKISTTIFNNLPILRAIRIMDTKYPTLQIFNCKCYYFPVIPDQFFKLDDTTVDYIMVNYKATNINTGPKKSISGISIALETE